MAIRHPTNFGQFTGGNAGTRRIAATFGYDNVIAKATNVLNTWINAKIDPAQEIRGYLARELDTILSNPEDAYGRFAKSKNIRSIPEDYLPKYVAVVYYGSLALIQHLESCEANGKLESWLNWAAERRRYGIHLPRESALETYEKMIESLLMLLDPEIIGR